MFVLRISGFNKELIKETSWVGWTMQEIDFGKMVVEEFWTVVLAVIILLQLRKSNREGQIRANRCYAALLLGDFFFLHRWARN